MWAEVPMLFALHRSVPGLIPAYAKDPGARIRVVRPGSSELHRTEQWRADPQERPTATWKEAGP